MSDTTSPVPCPAASDSFSSPSAHHHRPVQLARPAPPPRGRRVLRHAEGALRGAGVRGPGGYETHAACLGGAGETRAMRECEKSGE